MVLLHFLSYQLMTVNNLKPQILCCLEIDNCLKTRRHLLSTFNKSIDCLYCVYWHLQSKISCSVCKRRWPTWPSSFSIRLPSHNNDLLLSLSFAPKIYCLPSQQMALGIHLFWYNMIHLSNTRFEKPWNIAILWETFVWNIPSKYSF